LFYYLVYFFETIFGRGLSESVLQSPTFAAMSKTCLYFRYQISSPKIMLKISAKTAAGSNFKQSATVLFTDQEKVGSWNDDVVQLVDGVVQFQVIAVKTGVSENVHYVKFSFSKLSSCPKKGSSLLTVFVFYLVIWKQLWPWLIGYFEGLLPASYLGNLGSIVTKRLDLTGIIDGCTDKDIRANVKRLHF